MCAEGSLIGVGGSLTEVVFSSVCFHLVLMIDDYLCTSICGITSVQYVCLQCYVCFHLLYCLSTICSEVLRVSIVYIYSVYFYQYFG